MLQIRNYTLGFTVLFSFSKVLAAPLLLSPEIVAQKVLQQSYQAREIRLQAQQEQLTLANVEKLLDYQISAEIGFQDSKFQSASQSYLLQTNSLISTATVAKPFRTGTTLSLQYAGSSDSPTYSSSAPTPASDLTVNTLGLILEQDLWRNFFGEAQRADLRSAKSSVLASSIQEKNSLQALVLQSVQTFWEAYVAREAYQEALNSRERYLKLVQSVQKKSGYGYTSPGELAQAQAELENREQRVRTQTVAYRAGLDRLLSLLVLPTNTEIEFALPTNLPLPPTTTPVDHEGLRAIQASRLKLQAAEENLNSTRSQSRPDLSVVGKIYSQGFDSSLGSAQEEMLNGSNPKYYVGLQYQYNFGSGYQAESVRNRQLARDLAEAQLARQQLQIQDRENDIRRRLQSNYEIVVSAKEQKALREKAVQQLTRSYNQGRTDIAILIDALNKSFDSEVQLSRAIGNYQIALIEWDAFRDQLVLDSK